MHIRVRDENKKTPTQGHRDPNSAALLASAQQKKKNIRLHIYKRTETDKTNIDIYRTQTNLHIHIH